MGLERILGNVAEWIVERFERTIACAWPHNLYLRVGEIIESRGFDSVVRDSNLRKLAKRYAKKHDMLDDYNNALVRYAVSGLKSE